MGMGRIQKFFFGHIKFLILYLIMDVKLTPGYSDLKLKEVGARDIKMGMIYMKMMFKTMELDEISLHILSTNEERNEQEEPWHLNP